MDWDDLRFLLAVARHGSHAAAARALGVAQPTVGRRLEALQHALGVRLLERRAGHTAPTAAGAALLARAERVEEQVLSAERAARAVALESELAGCVRITAPDWIVGRALPGAVEAVAAQAPALRLDLRAEPQHVALAGNGADLALRPGRFAGRGEWQRAVGHAAFALYASASYLERRGLPRAADRGRGHALVLMDDSTGPIADVRWLQAAAARARVLARVNGREAMARLALAGVGIACLPVVVGDASPGLRRVESLGEAPARTLWLGVHRDQRRLRRVQLVSEAIRRAVRGLLPPPTA